MRTRRTLRGHLAKIYAMHWGTDSRCVGGNTGVPGGGWGQSSQAGIGKEKTGPAIRHVAGRTAGHAAIPLSPPHLCLPNSMAQCPCHLAGAVLVLCVPWGGWPVPSVSPWGVTCSLCVTRGADLSPLCHLEGWPAHCAVALLSSPFLVASWPHPLVVLVTWFRDQKSVHVVSGELKQWCVCPEGCTGAQSMYMRGIVFASPWPAHPTPFSLAIPLFLEFCLCSHLFLND